MSKKKDRQQRTPAPTKPAVPTTAAPTPSPKPVPVAVAERPPFRLLPDVRGIWGYMVGQGWAQLRSPERFQGLGADGNHPLYRLAFSILTLFLLIWMPVMSFDYGMTWDEPVLVEYAEDIFKYYASFGEDKQVFDMNKHARNATMHYGASFDLFAHIVHKYMSPFDIYDTRHLLNALTGALGLLFIGRIGRELGSWRTGLLAVVLGLITPMYFGHSMNNPKDVPFLLGYAMSLFYLIRYLKTLPNPSWGTLFWLVISMSFMISIKIGGLIVIGYFGLFSGVAWLWVAYQQGMGTAVGQLPKYALYVGGGTLAAYLLGILFWPWGIEKPIENPLASLTEFSNFRFLITYELFEGQRINMDSPPAHYTFKWIGITMPLVVLLGLIPGLMPLARRWKMQQEWLLLLMVFAFFFPIAYTIFKNSTLYSSWRHLFFVFVPLVVVSAAGWDFIWQITKQKTIQYAVIGVLAVTSALPIVWMFRNHPNEYIYFNELIGGINGAYKEYETEYWCNAMREATEWLIANEPVKDRYTRVAANFEINSAQHYANRYTDSLRMIWTRENEKYKPNWDYAFFGSRGMPKELIEASFPPKGTIHVIKVDSVPILAIVKRENTYLPDAYQLRDEGKIEEALENARKAVDYEPNNVEAVRLLGTLLINKGDYDEGVKTLARCIKINPDDFAAYTMIGIALYNQRDYQKAITFLNKSIELKVNNTSGYLNRARCYTALKDYNTALKDLEQAAYYDNNTNPRIYFEAAYIMMQQGLAIPAMKQNRFELAIRNLQQSIQMNPDFLEAYQNLAYAYQEIGDAENAQKYMMLLQQRMQN